MADLEQLVRRLLVREVGFVLVGGLAAVAHGATLVTRDTDICCPFDFANMRKLYGAIADLHPVHRTPQKLPLEVTPELCSRLKNLYLSTDAGALDCLGEITGIGGFEAVKRRSVEVTLWERPCRILSLEGLIAAKEAMGRTQDRLALMQLRCIQARQRHR